MLMKGSAENKNHSPILHLTWIISPYLFFHKRLFSLSYLTTIGANVETCSAPNQDVECLNCGLVFDSVHFMAQILVYLLSKDSFSCHGI